MDSDERFGAVLNLDPGKLLIIAVVAILILGPDRLPQVARQIGGTWRSFNDFRQRMETEMRSNMPDLPSTSEIARLARSPSALLDNLANMNSSNGPIESPIEAQQAIVDDDPPRAPGNADGPMTWVTVEFSETVQMAPDLSDSEGSPTVRSHVKPSDHKMSVASGFDASLN